MSQKDWFYSPKPVKPVIIAISIWDDFFFGATGLAGPRSLRHHAGATYGFLND